MTWNTRLAALLLAGGSVAGCSSSRDTPNVEIVFTCDANPDPCCGEPDSATCHNWQKIDAGVDAGTDAGFPTFQCNANPDPCCGEPDSATCHDGHTIDAGVDAGPDSGFGFVCNASPDPCCGYPDAAACPYRDAGTDSGDAGTD